MEIKHIGKFTSGKHGVVGKCEKNGKEVVYKISKYLNFIVEHEYKVMKSLEKINPYCPHFCKVLDIEDVKLDINFRKADDPFRDSKNKFPSKMITMEEIPNSVKFSSFIRNPDVPDEIIFSVIKQLVLAIIFAQRDCKFSHYDLHSSNVLMKKCDFDTVHVYKLDEDNVFAIPTYGYYPVIIDFGFSYVEDVSDDFILSPLNYSNIGYTTNIFDPIADLKVLLVSLTYEISGRRPEGKFTKTFDNIIKNLFHELNIQWDCGWDDYEKTTAIEKISTTLVDFSSSSALFSDVEFWCFDLIQNMIHYPLRDNPVKDLKKSFKLFIKQFNKLEKDFSNGFYRLYLLKSIVTAAKNNRVEYISGDRKEAVRNFKNDLFDEIRQVKKFYNPECDFENLLCGIIIFSQCMEGCLYKECHQRQKYKQNDYQKMTITDVNYMFGIIDYNINLPYKYRKYTDIKIFDRVEKDTIHMKVDNSDYITILNTIDHIKIGTIINMIYKEDPNINNIITKNKIMQTPNINDNINQDELESSTEPEDSEESDGEYEYMSDYEV